VICPDSGCDTAAGVATILLGGNPRLDAIANVGFSVFGNLANDLKFTPNGEGGVLQIDPAGEFKLGTLTFTNGLWTGDAVFGFSIVVQDSGFSKFNGVHTFTGFVNLGLTAPTDPNASPEANADYIFLTDANGNPVKNPVTLETLPSMRVYEAFDAPPGTSNVGTATLYGQLGSLDLTRLADPTGGAFLDISLTPDLGGPPIQQARYHICPLYDQNVAKKSGSAYPIKLQLCDADGNNLSSSSIVVHAVRVTQVNTNSSATLDDTGNANPDFDFRYDLSLNGYIFNLSTKGYASGTYSVNFTAGSDPTMYSALFAVK
jgi:hypothetical protein